MKFLSRIPRKILLSLIMAAVLALSTVTTLAVLLPASAHNATPVRSHYHLLVDWSKKARIQELDGAVTCPQITEPSSACTKGPDTVDFDVNVISFTPNGFFDISAASLADQCTSIVFSPTVEFGGDTGADTDLGDVHLNPSGNLHIHAHGENCVAGKYTIDLASDVFDGKHLSVGFTIVE